MRRSFQPLCVAAAVSTVASYASALTIVVSGAGNAPAEWNSFHVQWPDPNQVTSILDVESEARAPGTPPPAPVSASQNNHGITGGGTQYTDSNWANNQATPRYAVSTIDIVAAGVPAGITAYYDLTTPSGTQNFASFTPTVTILPEPTLLAGLLLLGPGIRRCRAQC